MSKIRIAIIGCNNMGGKHLKVIREYFSQKVEIAGILNSSLESTQKKAKELGIPYFTALEDITPETVDGVIIAPPVTHHYPYAKYCLEHNIPCLLEKPFALTETQCQELTTISQTKNVPLLIGYVELYNPAVQALKNLISASSIRKIKAVRTTRSYGTNTDSTIISNLMSHDISVALLLTGANAEQVADITTTSDPTRNLQSFAQAKITFTNGLKFKFEAETTPEQEVTRIMQIQDTDNNLFVIDFLDRKLTINNQETVFSGNSLALELEDFISSIENKHTPFANATKALEVEKISLMAEKKLKEKPTK